ncbi:MAG: hypothetical protein MJ208_02620, partial [Bacilli bacterium]|nr:hypothetical protein [Bacilli bacterium]
MKKLQISSPFFIAKRMDISKRDSWLIRIGGMLIAFLLAGIICTALKPGSFFAFYKGMFVGSFGYMSDFLCIIAIYLLLSLAVTPAFKMRFWNIGVEGQAMVGCVVTAPILLLMPASIPNALIIIIALVAGVLAGIVWALIPTIFKIKFNTNETLFTLMMNYIATALAAFTIAMCSQGGSQTFPAIPSSRLIVSIGSVKYIPIIAAAVVITVILLFYLKKAKKGFELSILGDSPNTARYVGINISKVSIRTMIISGAIAGLVGFLLVAGKSRTLTDTLVGGKGFTAVLISWLGHFNPIEIVVYSAVVGFFDIGTTYAAGTINIQTYFAGLVLGLFILVVIVSEFFIRYQVKKRMPNEISEAQNNILNISDILVNQAVLLKEFFKYNPLIKEQELKEQKQNLKKFKYDYRKKAHNLRQQILFKSKDNKKSKDELKKDLDALQTSYMLEQKKYRDVKQKLSIAYKAQRIVLSANTRRVKMVIKNKMDAALLAIRSGSMIYRNKDELDVFFKNLKYTNWQ